MSETPRRRPGGRTARTWEAVHKAVRDLMAEGAPEILIADVAARAGVHPTTIYRRWGSVENLVVDVTVARLEAEAPVPATGDLRADLLAYAEHVLADITRPGGLAFLHAVIAAARHPGGEMSALDFLSRRGAQMQVMLDRAGPAAAGVTMFDVVDGVLAPIYLRVLAGAAESVTRKMLERLVDRLLA